MATLAGVTLTRGVVSALIGRQILTQAISEASGSIYTSISSIFSYNTNLDELLLQLDIKERVKNFESLINQIRVNNDTVTSCIQGLHEIIILIREDLKQIDLKIQKHREKYFSSWRSLGCTKQKKHLIIHSNLLDKRLDYLIKALSILKYSQGGEEIHLNSDQNKCAKLKTL
jgi:hypothetical protein